MLEIIVEDITKLNVDAIVNAANPSASRRGRCGLQEKVFKKCATRPKTVINSMFGSWSKSKKSIEEQQRSFDEAYEIILEASLELRREYDRVLKDPNIRVEVDGILKQYDSPDFLSESRDAIFAMRRDKQFSSTFLKTTSLMFITMMDHAFPSLSLKKPSYQKDDLASFAYWVSCLSPGKRRDVARIAYIATIAEQHKAGNTSATALTMRILWVTLVANANDDNRSKQIARELLALVDER